MSDLISRQDAINVADAVWSVTGDKNVAKVWDQIKDLPSAQPEPHWIPCKERLPEKNGMYFVSTDSDHLPPGYQTTDVITWHDGKWIMADYFVLDEEMRKKPEYRVVEVAIPILAWMPLPEPYKEGES